jgi:dienelactone hydrolase
MSRRRAVSISLVIVAFALLAGSGQALAAGTFHRADGSVADWIGTPTMLSGESRMSRGELIYDDWVYDDYGADLDRASNPPVFRSNLAPTRGDYRYPTNSARYGYNAADLRELRVAVDGNGLHVVTFLQTMMAADAAAVTIGIDADDDPATGATTWPQRAGIDTPGVDRFITFWGSAGFVTDSHGHRTRISRQAVNLSENAIEVDVPWRYLGRIRGRSVRLYAVTGLADPQARGYVQVPTGPATSTNPGGGLAGGTAVFDAGFDANEVSTRVIGSHWGEELQSSALASRDVSALGRTVDLHELEDGDSDDYAPAPGHFYDRLFRSTQDFGEGISLKNPTGQNAGGSPEPQFLSPYQPYGLYIPASYQEGTPAPLLINGHSLDVNQNEYAVVSPNLYNQLGDQRSSFVITPLARGMDTWYITAGFKDVLEAWDDLEAHYSIDDERTSIGGYSMGGYMTYRMGLLMPDRFAAAAAYVGPPAYQLWEYPAPPQPSSSYQVAGQTNNIVYNGLDLPFEINNGVPDELVPVSGAQQQAQTFRDVGNPHLFYLYPGADHLALIVADEWGHTRDWLDQYPQRDLSPDEVRFKRYPSMDLPQYGLHFDGAYWVDGMAVRSPSDSCTPGTSSCQAAFGQVEAYTLAHGRARSTTNAINTAYSGPGLPATVQGTERVPGGAIAAENTFEASLVNLAAVTFELDGMGIDPAATITGRLTVDVSGGVTVTLRGDFGPVSATLDGHPVQVEQVTGGIAVDVSGNAGQHTLIVTPQ